MIAALVLALVLAAGLAPARANTLADVKAKGFLACGVVANVPGFSNEDAKGHWSGLDTDYCRALASAIFDDPGKVHFVALETSTAIPALADASVDLLAGFTPWSMHNTTGRGIRVVGTLFYDGQGFMVHKSAGITSSTHLSGDPICMQSGTQADTNAASYFLAHNMVYKPLRFDSLREAVKAYADGRCTIFTADRSAMAAARSRLPDPKANIILPSIISKEPFGPAVRNGDADWFNIARWTLFALIDAEALGVTSANVDGMLGTDNSQIKRLLGVEDDLGTPLGLTKDWAYRIVKLVGNYGEIYANNVGPKTPIGLERGLNNLWTRGGIQYAPPVR